jgi:HK97 family phage prohead protease
MQLEVRFFSDVDMEVRGREGRTVTGLLVPFDRPTTIGTKAGSFTEVIRAGAFRDVERRPPLYAMHRHNLDMPIGRFEVLREDTRGLYGEAPIATTAAGDEALELVRAGVLDSFSVGFNSVPDGDRWSRDRRSVERLRVHLREASLVAIPAYADAVVESVRDEDGANAGAGHPRMLELRRYLASRPA